MNESEDQTLLIIQLTGTGVAVSIPATKMIKAVRRAIARFRWMYSNTPLLRDFLVK